MTGGWSRGEPSPSASPSPSLRAFHLSQMCGSTGHRKAAVPGVLPGPGGATLLGPRAPDAPLPAPSAPSLCRSLLSAQGSFWDAPWPGARVFLARPPALAAGPALPPARPPPSALSETPVSWPGDGGWVKGHPAPGSPRKPRVCEKKAPHGTPGGEGWAAKKVMSHDHGDRCLPSAQAVPSAELDAYLLPPGLGEQRE